MKSDNERYRELAALAQMGWLETDLTTEECLCSDFLCDLFDLKSKTISFPVFFQLIREDCREEFTQEFVTGKIALGGVYEQTVPFNSRYGETWLHIRFAPRKPDNSANSEKRFLGMVHRVDPPDTKNVPTSLHCMNNLLSYQAMISRSLLRFLNDEKVDSCITDILRDILNLYHGNRVYIFKYNNDLSSQSCIYEVVSENVSPEKENLQDIAVHRSRWWSDQILSGKSIILNTLEQLPEEAGSEFEILSSQGIKSIIIVPLMACDSVWGYMGVDITDRTREWQNEDYSWLSSLANIISICIELRKAKDNVNRDQAFLHNLFKHMPMGYIRLTVIRDANGIPCDYRVTDSNEICSKFFGRPREFYEGKLASDIYNTHAEKVKGVAEILESKMHKEMDEYFSRTGIYTHWVMYTPEENEVVGLFTDSTDTIKANRAIDRSEKLFRSIFANIPAGVEIYNNDGYLTDLNNKDMEIFGIVDKTSVIGLNLFDNQNMPQEFRDRVRKEDTVDFRMTYSFKLATHNYFKSYCDKSMELYVKVSKIYDKEGNFNGYVLINIDNTEQIDTINRIHDFENFFLFISEYAKVGYTKFNILSGTGYALKQWYKNMGESENTPLDKIIGVYSKIHPDDRKHILECLADVKSGTVRDFQREVRVMRPETKNEWNWIQMNLVVTAYKPEDGIIELLGINYDITELKETEFELIKARDKAETMDRLKSAFLANMSHEIRTPLNAIVGFSDLLVDTEDMEERREYVKIVQMNNGLLLQLISDILDLSKIEAGTFEISNHNVDVKKLCKDIVLAMQLKAKEGVQIIFDECLPDYHIVSDRNRLQQVISNFVNNATKFTYEGSICVRYERKGKELEFSVTDTGVGIDEVYLSQIFKRFVKLNSFVQGTGLGLPICQSIIEQLGGQIGVESKLGKGSRFWFTLPYTRVPEETNDFCSGIKGRKIQIKNGGQKPVILVAEDTDSNYLLISAILRRNYCVERAYNGSDAVKMYQLLNPDLILMDIRMPEMDGIEATKQIRKFNDKIPILAITAFTFEQDKADALNAGCSGFVTKPIIAEILHGEIQKCLES